MHGDYKLKGSKQVPLQVCMGNKFVYACTRELALQQKNYGGKVTERYACRVLFSLLRQANCGGMVMVLQDSCSPKWMPR